MGSHQCFPHMMHRLLHQMVGLGCCYVVWAAFDLFTFQNAKIHLILCPGSVCTRHPTCRHLKLIDLCSLDINSHSVDLNKKFSEFYTAYNIIVDQWNEFAGQQIPCTTFSSGDNHIHRSHYIIVLPIKKSLTTTFAQDSNGHLLFPPDLDVKTKTPENLWVLVKTFMDDLWRELNYVYHSCWIYTESCQISIGLLVLTFLDYCGIILLCIHRTKIGCSHTQLDHVVHPWHCMRIWLKHYSALHKGLVKESETCKC